jgi:hypothetical protein
MPLTRVLFEPVRSAEPPIISGIAGISWSSAEPEWTRVALTGLVSRALAMWASSASKALAGSSPFMARVKSDARVEAASLASQALRTLAPRRPTLFQAVAMSPGTVNGSASQPMATRASRIWSSNRV